MDDRLRETLLACETGVWEALVKGDSAADSAALAEDFLGVYPDGFSGKAEHVAQLSAGPSVRQYKLSDLRIIPLGPKHAAIVYCADFVGLGKDGVSRMYVTSIWRAQAGRWVNIHSQDTPVGGSAGVDWV